MVAALTTAPLNNPLRKPSRFLADSFAKQINSFIFISPLLFVYGLILTALLSHKTDN